MSVTSPRSSLRDFAEKLPFLHPQPTPRSSRDWTRDESRRTSIGLPTPLSVHDGSRSNFLAYGRRRGWRRQLSLSSFSLRGCACLLLVGMMVFGIGMVSLGYRKDVVPLKLGGGIETPVVDNGGTIPLGQSRQRGGKEVFWWEQFEKLNGYYGGRKEIVAGSEWVSEQEGGMKLKNKIGGAGTQAKEVVSGQTSDTGSSVNGLGKRFAPCYIDESKGILPPKIAAYDGLPQGFPAPLLGSHKELGLRHDVCYDRIKRFEAYGVGFPEEMGGTGLGIKGDTEGRERKMAIDFRLVSWNQAQKKCTESKRYDGPRTAFVIRTWDDFFYTTYHITMLRAIISELALTSGGKYTVHFLIHVKDDKIPIWASETEYNRVLKASLPAEFAGMGTLWSVAQMKLIYPGPFPESIVNFSGEDLYTAYRSLHFPLQYFAEKHPEYSYFWNWEMDIRVTGGYNELLESVTKWAENKKSWLLWEKSAQFYMPSLYEDSYERYEGSVIGGLARSGAKPVAGPQLPEKERLSIPGVTDRSPFDEDVDLITFSPLFNPEKTRWAFHDDITGYPRDARPPTRAALITAARLSRRLLRTMHREAYERKHTMFPEMFPASVALHYGYKAIYAPLPIYFDRDWPAKHANQVFNNAKLDEESKAAGMSKGSDYFHSEGGSVFGPGEHVFRGASWYSNAGFAQDLWRRWLGVGDDEKQIAWEMEKGRMCLPMMVLHPIKNE